MTKADSSPEGFGSGLQSAGRPQQGGYRPRQNSYGGGYNNSRGGYQSRPQQGGYHPRQIVTARKEGYQPRQQGGYNNRGGYQSRPQQGGYRPRYNNDENGYQPTGLSSTLQRQQWCWRARRITTIRQIRAVTSHVRVGYQPVSRVVIRAVADTTITVAVITTIVVDTRAVADTIINRGGYNNRGGYKPGWLPPSA